jgi:ricin-type beta-trefoil lectin protein/putative Ig domain-containing protein
MHLLPASPTGRRPASRWAGLLATSAILASGGAVAAPGGPAGWAAAQPSRIISTPPPPAGQPRATPMTVVGTGTPHHRGAVPDQAPPGYGPAQLQSAYNLAAAASSQGGGETVAVVAAYDDPQAASDLAVYRAQYGLPGCDTGTGAGCVTTVNEQGQASPLPGPEPSGNDWAQDESVSLDMISAICPGCHILLVEASTSSITDLGTAENSAAASGAKFVANGWSTGEFGTENYYDSLYFDHPGVAITAAAGGSGYGTSWPSSSQFVTSVGGTSLTAATGSARGWTETVWNDGNGHATGAGCSLAEPKPSWQNIDDSTPGGCLNRTGNDVAAVADPQTGVAVYDTYNSGAGWSVAGGTSVASPIIASVYALAGAPAAASYPASYPYQSGQATQLYDVTTGSDGSCEAARQYLCNAGTGYDGPTGLGTPDGVAAFQNTTTGHIVTLTDPGTQDEETGTPVFVAMRAAHPTGFPLKWSAKGLPAGLSIGAHTGRITGTLTGSASISQVTVTAADSTGAAGSVTFSLVAVKPLTTGYHLVSGPVRLDLGGKCLDDLDNGTSPGTEVVSSSCNGHIAQNWAYHPDGNPGGAGMLTIHSLCLDLKGGATAPQTKTVLGTCDGAASQQWQITGSAGQLYSTDAGLCLADPGSSTANRTQQQVSVCNGAANQAWTLPASPVQSGVAGLCVDDAGGVTSNGNKIQVWNCNGNVQQKWADEPDETLRLNGGKCLTVSGGSKLDGAKVVLDACGAGGDQQWVTGPGGELINVNSGRCLDDPGNSTANGTALVQQDCYGQPGEIWALT